VFDPDLVESTTPENAISLIGDGEAVLGAFLPRRFAMLYPGIALVQRVRGVAPRHPREYLGRGLHGCVAQWSGVLMSISPDYDLLVWPHDLGSSPTPNAHHNPRRANAAAGAGWRRPPAIGFMVLLDGLIV
jgi:hypothetical protein